MAAYSLSPKAAEDIDGIYEYTILNFGLERAREYLSGMHDRFQYLAENPMHGRTADQLATELKRMEYRSHVVLYLPKDNGVRIIRVLHSSMDAPRHL